MTDDELRMAIAVEIYGYAPEDITSRWEIRQLPILTTVPVQLPDWPRVLSHTCALEELMRDRQLWAGYQRHLQAVCGKTNTTIASPKQRAAAALAAIREDRHSD